MALFIFTVMSLKIKRVKCQRHFFSSLDQNETHPFIVRRNVLMHWKQRNTTRRRPNHSRREKPVLQEASPRASPEGLMLTDEVITAWPRSRDCKVDGSQSDEPLPLLAPANQSQRREYSGLVSSIRVWKLLSNTQIYLSARSKRKGK